jgi:hypothetical protein
MPATDRRDFSEVVGDLEPNLFEVTVDEAIARLDADRLLARIPYQAKGIDVVDNEIGKLLVISDRETSEQRNRLIDEHTAQVTPQIVADNETDVRAQVLADFAASGVIPTPEQVDAAVAAGLQALIDADVQAYVDGALSADLEAALQPLLRLELKPTHFGKLQSEDILKIEDYDLIHFHHRDAFYYRDHYEPLVEDTKAKRLADNLRSKPAYRSTPDGPVFDV